MYMTFISHNRDNATEFGRETGLKKVTCIDGINVVLLVSGMFRLFLRISRLCFIRYVLFVCKRKKSPSTFRLFSIVNANYVVHFKALTLDKRCYFVCLLIDRNTNDFESIQLILFLEFCQMRNWFSIKNFMGKCRFKVWFSVIFCIGWFICVYNAACMFFFCFSPDP